MRGALDRRLKRILFAAEQGAKGEIEGREAAFTLSHINFSRFFQIPQNSNVTSCQGEPVILRLAYAVAPQSNPRSSINKIAQKSPIKGRLRSSDVSSRAPRSCALGARYPIWLVAILLSSSPLDQSLSATPFRAPKTHQHDHE